MAKKQHGLKGRTNNPAGKPAKHGATEMVSKRLPIELMNKVRNKTNNATEFIRQALEEKLAK